MSLASLPRGEQDKGGERTSKRKWNAHNPSPITIRFRHPSVHDLRAIGSIRVCLIHGCKPESLADHAFGVGGRLHVENINLRRAPPAYAGGWVGVVLALARARRELLPREGRQHTVRVGVAICRRGGGRYSVGVRLIWEDANVA
jgi:hypothetical protein